MKELPIPFSAPMVRAILDCRKTVTRRVVRPQPDWLPEVHATNAAGAGLYWPIGSLGQQCGMPLTKCPYGQPGDRLWVREAWRVPVSLDDLSGKQIAEKCLDAGYATPWCPTQYEADGARTSEKDWREFGPHPSTAVPGRYRHSRFMPRWASRITLEVTGVRVERLQDITEADAEAEGAEALHAPTYTSAERELLDLPLLDMATPYRNGFASLWEQINGAGSWGADPWVWVVEFRRIVQEAKAA